MIINGMMLAKPTPPDGNAIPKYRIRGLDSLVGEGIVTEKCASDRSVFTKITAI
jgi:hypothetical protein